MPAIAAQQSSQIEQLRAIARQLDQLAHRERSAFVKAQAERIAVSEKTLYRWLKDKAGWSSGRKTRADAGITSVSDESLRTVAALQKVSVRKNGKLIMQMPVAASIAMQNGIALPVGNSQLSRLLRDRGLSPKQQSIASPHVAMRSLHPNHTHQVDPSLCVLYYLNGKQAMMRDDEFYKNKLDNYAKIKLKVWRYVLEDHASSSLVVRYYESAGENPGILADFLLYAWRKQDGRYFHGVPLYLIWDKGSANTSAQIKSLLDSLEVNHIPHARGNARAKGGVEGANNLVETQFECRLRLEPVNSVDELNAAAMRWCEAFNCGRIPGQNTLLKRKGMTAPAARSDLWHWITAEQLRLLPDERVCREFLRGKAAMRKVGGDLCIGFKHPVLGDSRRYDLTGCDGINVGDSVEVTPLIYGDGLIVVSMARYDGQVLSYRLAPLAGFDRFGFRLDAPVFGESFKAKPMTDLERNAVALDKTAFGDLPAKALDKAKDKAVPFAGELVAHSHLADADLPHYLPRKGSVITSGQRFDEQPMSVIAAAKQLKASLGERYGEFHLRYLKQHYPDGITPTAFEALLTQFNSSTSKEAVSG